MSRNACCLAAKQLRNIAIIGHSCNIERLPVTILYEPQRMQFSFLGVMDDG